jgi:hypothetical protein
VGDTSAAALTTTYSIPRVTSQVRHVEGAPFGTRGGTVVTHDFPADGDYVFKLGFYYSPTGPLFGLHRKGGTQSVLVARHENEVNLLGHQAIRNDGYTRVDATFRQKRDVFLVVVVVREEALTAIPPL